jgi:hypothetical protein
MNHFTINCAVIAFIVTAAVPGTTGPAFAAGPASITKAGTTWTLENDVLRTVISFANGSIDMTSFYNKLSGTEYLTGAGDRYLFRHVCDGEVLKANDGNWSLGVDTTGDISLYDRHWGKQLAIDISRASSRISLTLIFEIFDGRSGMRYYSYIKNDDARKEKTISASDIIALNFPNRPHTIFYVPWQLKWARTRGELAWGKRNCITRYDAGSGWALIPENNWCTSLAPGKEQGDPKHPYLFLNAWSGTANVKVSTDTMAVKLVLFPNERIEYFSVDLQVFKGDEFDARTAVAEHFRKRFKYHNALPQIEFQEYRVEFLQNDAMVRQYLAPALSESGFDKWEVTWMWNGAGGDDRASPKPEFTSDLPALADFVQSKGLKIGYYFCMDGCGWGCGRDLADPAQIAFKQRQVEDTLIGMYHSTWQMIDLGELWKNDSETSYSHPSDNVYRKGLLLRNYMNYMTHKYPEFITLTTCETENPIRGWRTPNGQSVALMDIADNGQAGTYCRTDNDNGALNQSALSNLADAFNYIGLMPVEAFVGVYGEGGTDPWPAMFTAGYYYATLLGGCSTYYSDVRNWTTAQKAHMRLFNDWRKSCRIASLLRELARPLYNGPGNNSKGPYAWMYADSAATKAILIATGSSATIFNVNLRALSDDKKYIVEDVSLVDGGTFNYAPKIVCKGAALKNPGFAVNLAESGSRGKAYWIQEISSANPAVIYADAAITTYSETWNGSSLTVNVTGQANTRGTVIIYKPSARGTEKKTVSIGSGGSGSVTFDATAVDPLPRAVHTFRIDDTDASMSDSGSSTAAN